MFISCKSMGACPYCKREGVELINFRTPSTKNMMCSSCLWEFMTINAREIECACFTTEKKERVLMQLDAIIYDIENTKPLDNAPLAFVDQHRIAHKLLDVLCSLLSKAEYDTITWIEPAWDSHEVNDLRARAVFSLYSAFSFAYACNHWLAFEYTHHARNYINRIETEN